MNKTTFKFSFQVGQKTNGFNFLLLLMIATFLFAIQSCGQTKKSKEEKEESYNKVLSAWGNLESQYQRRSDLVSTLANMVKHSENSNDAIITRVLETRKEIGEFGANFDSLTIAKFEQYENLQVKFAKDIPGLLSLSKNYPSASQMANEFEAMLPKTNVSIDKARNEFVPLFKEYKSQ